MTLHEAAPGRLQRLITFARSLLAGLAATLADLLVLGVAVGALGLSARVANVPALLVGATVQFLGNRHFAFQSATEGSLKRQMLWASLVELVSFGANGLIYDQIAQRVALDTVGALLLRCAVCFVIYVLWSYPLFTRVFKAPTAREPDADPPRRAA